MQLKIVSPFLRISPEAIVLLSFASAIITGTILLSLPISHNDSVGFLDALFTSTSAVCVTGLVVVDTGNDFTHFGQMIILLLIQLGGLGIMTFAALAFDLLGKRLSINSQEAMTRELVHRELAAILRRQFRKMLFLVLTIEGAGAIILFIGMLPSDDMAFTVWSAIFHSVSAFCNAGFSLYADNIIGFKDNLIIVYTIAILIIVGGIGHPVLFNLINAGKNTSTNKKHLWSQVNVHTKIVLITTLALIVSGFFLLIVTSNNKVNVSSALFQSITARTAGFNTIPIDGLPLSSLLVLIILMFIGGSPGSCAGGVKTTTFALWINQLWNRVRGRSRAVFFERYIAEPLVRRSSTIISLSVLLNILGVFILSITENKCAHHGLHAILFEQISAFGTVGLSTGITPDLSQTGRLWILLTMFIGRTGTLTSVLLLLKRKPLDIKYPEGKVMIG